MNKVILIGRMTGDPDIRQTTGENSTEVARYRLAVDRRGEGADFIPCAAFGKSAEFAERYLKKGMKIAVFGRIQTGSYTNKDGQKVYTTDVIVDEHEFCERRETPETPKAEANDGFVNIPDNITDLPFN